MGNLASIRNMLKKLGFEALITGTPADLERASHLILPGVGAFDTGMRSLEERGLLPVLEQRVLSDNIPILGICLGMQLLSRSSAEGERRGLGWIDADTVAFDFSNGENLRVPHMGWNAVTPTADCELLDRSTEQRFYFVHSYHVRCDCPEDVAAISRYGIDVTAVVRRGNIVGAQFHPEKSHRFGMQFLSKFLS